MERIQNNSGQRLMAATRDTEIDAAYSEEDLDKLGPVMRDYLRWVDVIKCVMHNLHLGAAYAVKAARKITAEETKPDVEALVAAGGKSNSFQCAPDLAKLTYAVTKFISSLECYSFGHANAYLLHCKAEFHDHVYISPGHTTGRFIHQMTKLESLLYNYKQICSFVTTQVFKGKGMQQIVKSIYSQLCNPAIMIEAYCTSCLGATVFKPVQVLLGIDFLDGTPERDGEDLVKELHSILDESAAAGDVHDRAMRGVEFVQSFLTKQPTAPAEDDEADAAELATALEAAADAAKAAVVKNADAAKVLALTSKVVVALHETVLTWIDESKTAGYKEWLREGVGASLHDYKEHFPAETRDRLAQTALPAFCSLRITVARVLGGVAETCILNRIEDKVVTYFIDGAPDLGPLPPSTQGAYFQADVLEKTIAFMEMSNKQPPARLAHPAPPIAHLAPPTAHLALLAPPTAHLALLAPPTVNLAPYIAQLAPPIEPPIAHLAPPIAPPIAPLTAHASHRP